MTRRLTLVIHSLSGGGAERTLADMANHWSSQAVQVTFVTLESPQQDRYRLDASVNRVCLEGMQHSTNLLQAVTNNLRRLYRLRRAIRHSSADVVISFTDKMNVLTLLACCGLRQRVIICERVDPRRHAIGRSWTRLRRWTYPRCAALVVQTRGVREYLARFVPDAKIHVIPNAVPVAETPEAGDVSNAQKERQPWILAVGRLESQKGFDLLVEAFARIAPRHPKWQLKILGDGSQRSRLTHQIQALGLEQSVELCGWTESPVDWFAQAELFVLSSRYEGFPNALLEAMAAGVPVISFDCDSGPAEIIRHDVDGLLVPDGDVEQLAEAIERLITNPKERRLFGQRARDVVQRFSRQQFFQRWEQVLNAVCPDSATSPDSTSRRES